MRKKWLSISAGILLALVITGCSNGDAGDVSPSTPSTSSAASEDTAAPASTAPSADMQKLILDRFETLLKMQGNEKAVLAEIRQDISQLTPKNADQMILSFEAYQRDTVKQGGILSGELVELIQTTADEPYNEKVLNDLSKITNTDLKIMLQTVFDRGYKFIVPEGMHEAVIDYSVYRDAAEYASPDIAAYIAIMAMESESRMSTDAAIIVPIDAVLVRAEASEAFLKAYPDSVKFEQIAERYMIYADAYFFGQDNTPAFDYSTNKLDQEFLDSYQKAMSGDSDSAIVKSLGDYLKILKDNDYTLTNTVTEYRKTMTDALKYTAS